MKVFLVSGEVSCLGEEEENIHVGRLGEVVHSLFFIQTQQIPK